jgi:hypothetical protein
MPKRSIKRNGNPQFYLMHELKAKKSVGSSDTLRLNETNFEQGEFSVDDMKEKDYLWRKVECTRCGHQRRCPTISKACEKVRCSICNNTQFRLL